MYTHGRVSAVSGRRDQVYCSTAVRLQATTSSCRYWIIVPINRGITPVSMSIDSIIIYVYITALPILLARSFTINDKIKVAN